MGLPPIGIPVGDFYFSCYFYFRIPVLQALLGASKKQDVTPDSSDGGAGGDAGGITISGGMLNPAPAQLVELYEIKGFPPGTLMQEEDDSCSRGRSLVGRVVEARNSAGEPLYRVRLSASGTSLLGGLGGIPSGVTGNNQGGVAGPFGASGSINGLPVQ